MTYYLKSIMKDKNNIFRKMTYYLKSIGISFLFTFATHRLRIVFNPFYWEWRICEDKVLGGGRIAIGPFIFDYM